MSGAVAIIYVRYDIAGKLLSKHSHPYDIKGLFLELNFRKSKWLLVVTCHPPSKLHQYLYKNVNKILHMYSNYEKYFANRRL